MHRSRRSAILIPPRNAVRRPGDVCSLDICDSKRPEHSRSDKTLACALTSLAFLRRRHSLAYAPSCLAASSLRHSLAHGLTDSPAAQSLRDGPEAGAAMPSGRSMQSRKARQSFAGCLTTRCSGGHEARFEWLLVRPFVAPLNVSVRPPRTTASTVVKYEAEKDVVPDPLYHDSCNCLRLL